MKALYNLKNVSLEIKLRNLSHDYVILVVYLLVDIKYTIIKRKQVLLINSSKIGNQPNVQQL